MQGAQVIDLSEYRKRKEQAAAPASAPMAYWFAPIAWVWVPFVVVY